jgi:hypothetical protein
MLWVRGLADFEEGINESILAVGLERNVKTDCCTIRRLAQGDPVVWDGIPFVLYSHVSPRGRKGCRTTAEEHSDEDGDHSREPAEGHDSVTRA